jgi:hypothetical protein
MWRTLTTALPPRGFASAASSLAPACSQRRMFQSALGPAGLQALLPRAQAVIQAHLAQWEAAAGGGCISSLFREVRPAQGCCHDIAGWA